VGRHLRAVLSLLSPTPRPLGEMLFLQNTSHFGNFCVSLHRYLFVRVIAKKAFRKFWENHGDCEQQLKAWYHETKKAEWKSPKDIKKEYPSSSILEGNRVVFNVNGNTYRLIVKINYEFQIVWIRFICTHSEYDKINANKI
jgi:mRNA interferase HigB